ncbi:hypothetical protein HAX54_038651 [Datura stramonium]|uniref:Uncharacterized protein n=1 Tax=Datura stramonium TaxID=4076 RepID=A0ABS8SJA3_DATST|nr:hypothetical protein [Datura stramonium]
MPSSTPRASKNKEPYRENTRLKHEIKMAKDMIHSQDDLFILENVYETSGMRSASTFDSGPGLLSLKMMKQ